MKRAGGGRSGGIKEGGRTAEVQPVGDCGGVDAGLPPPPLLHLTTTITSNLLRLMASLTDHPRFFLFFFCRGKKKKGILLRPHMKNPTNPRRSLFSQKLKS